MPQKSGPVMLWRRGLLSLAGITVAWGAKAQATFPNRPLSLIVPFPPGGSTDAIARGVADGMGRELGQNVIVDNKPGGGTSLAGTMVAQARPDGHTLLWGSASLAINPALQPSLTPRDPQKELAPIGLAYRGAYVLVVISSMPINTTAELIAYAMAHPGELNCASSGIGSTNHLALELFKSLTGTDLVHVPYRGAAQSLLDLRSGRVQVFFGGAAEIGPMVREGGLRPLAVTSPGRQRLWPDVPPLGETVPGFDVTSWQGLFAPAGTPAPVLTKLESTLLSVANNAELGRRLAEQGVDLSPGSAEEMRQLLANETVKWGKVIRDAGIRME